jgi:hypothetical protein
VTQGANVRPLPNTGNQPIGQVNQGDQVLFLARTGNGQWYLIRLGELRAAASRIDNPDGSGSGWINRALVTAPQADLPVQEPVIPPSPTAAPAPTASP